MKQKLYIDTSFVGGYYDTEFEEFTKPLIDRIRSKEFNIIYSSVTEEELENAPEKVKELIRIFHMTVLNMLRYQTNQLNWQ